MRPRSSGIIFAVLPVWVTAAYLVGAIALVLHEQRKTVGVVCVDEAQNGRWVYLPENSLREARKP